MTEKTKAPLTVAKGGEKTQGANTTTATTEAVKTFEELQKENEELKRKLSAVPEDLEKKIEYFNRKRLLIKRFDSLNEKKTNLLFHLDKVAEIATKNDFSNDRYSILIYDGEGGYNAKEVFKMLNPLIVCEVINFMISKVEAIQSTLQKQIEE